MDMLKAKTNSNIAHKPKKGLPMDKLQVRQNEFLLQLQAIYALHYSFAISLFYYFVFYSASLFLLSFFLFSFVLLLSLLYFFILFCSFLRKNHSSRLLNDPSLYSMVARLVATRSRPPRSDLDIRDQISTSSVRSGHSRPDLDLHGVKRVQISTQTTANSSDRRRWK